MGYESRLFIIKRNVYEIGDSIWISGQKLAEIELCCVGHNKNYVYFNEISRPLLILTFTIPGLLLTRAVTIIQKIIVLIVMVTTAVTLPLMMLLSIWKN